MICIYTIDGIEQFRILHGIRICEREIREMVREDYIMSWCHFEISCERNYQISTLQNIYAVCEQWRINRLYPMHQSVVTFAMNYLVQWGYATRRNRRTRRRRRRRRRRRKNRWFSKANKTNLTFSENQIKCNPNSPGEGGGGRLFPRSYALRNRFVVAKRTCNGANGDDVQGIFKSGRLQLPLLPFLNVLRWKCRVAEARKMQWSSRHRFCTRCFCGWCMIK